MRKQQIPAFSFGLPNGVVMSHHGDPVAPATPIGRYTVTGSAGVYRGHAVQWLAVTLANGRTFKAYRLGPQYAICQQG